MAGMSLRDLSIGKVLLMLPKDSGILRREREAFDEPCAGSFVIRLAA